MIVTIIPCFGEPIERVGRTVASAVAVPGMDRVILVDDGCDDASLDDLAGPTVDVLHLPENVGPSGAMAAGVALTGADDIICRLDVGDVFWPEVKARQIETVLAGVPASMSPHLDAISSAQFDPPPTWAKRLYTDGAFCVCTAVFTRHAHDVAGGFDTSLRYCDDWDFTMRMQHHVGWALFPEVTCKAGAFDGGHTQAAAADPVKAARKHADADRVRRRGHALAHPGRQPLRPAR